MVQLIEPVIFDIINEQLIKTNKRKEECDSTHHQIHLIHMNNYIHVVFFQAHIPVV